MKKMVSRLLYVPPNLCLQSFEIVVKDNDNNIFYEVKTHFIPNLDSKNIFPVTYSVKSFKLHIILAQLFDIQCLTFLYRSLQF